MKIIPPDELPALSTRLHGMNARIVLTHGVFDLIHPGVIDGLRKARSAGDCLVLALHSDASAANVYGPSRPIMSLTDRLEIMAALDMVSYVTWFEENQPEAIAQKIQPDVILPSPDDPVTFHRIIEKIIELPASSL